MACDCLADTNKLLAEHNTRLQDTLVVGRGDEPGYVAVTLSTERIEPRGKRPVAMLPTYCPFCGLPYAALLSAAAPSCEAVS